MTHKCHLLAVANARSETTEQTRVVKSSPGLRALCRRLDRDHRHGRPLFAKLTNSVSEFAATDGCATNIWLKLAITENRHEASLGVERHFGIEPWIDR
jgi:hypothetical protein